MANALALPLIIESKIPAITTPRLGVICVGKISDGLSDQLQLANLELLSVAANDLDSIKSEVVRLASSSRAVLIFTGPLLANLSAQRDLKKTLNQLDSCTFENGLRTIVVVDSDVKDDVALATGILNHVNYGSSATQLSHLRRLLRGLVQYDPGLPWRDLPISGRFDEEDKLLLQRAFCDCDSIAVQKVAPGKSVYRIDARRASRPEPVPFIAKVDSKAKIEQEYGNLTEICADSIAFPYIPALIQRRSVFGPRRSILVSHFVDRAVMLVTHGMHLNMNHAILSVFDEALRGWRANPQLRTYALGQYALQKGICSRHPEKYEDAYQACRLRQGETLIPAELLARLERLEARDVNEVYAHGDLHVRNIFVRQSGEVVLIDFRRSGEAPSSRDPAELECSIALDRQLGAFIDVPALDKLYQPPLLPFDTLPAAGNSRLEAICQIRLQLGALAGTPEYQIMVAIHLLWHAASRRSALAYRFAERLILDAETKP